MLIGTLVVRKVESLGEVHQKVFIDEVLEQTDVQFTVGLDLLDDALRAVSIKGHVFVEVPAVLEELLDLPL